MEHDEGTLLHVPTGEGEGHDLVRYRGTSAGIFHVAELLATDEEFGKWNPMPKMRWYSGRVMAGAEKVQADGITRFLAFPSKSKAFFRLLKGE